MSAVRDLTGGLRWHLRALLLRRRWRQTITHIAEWLATTRPASQTLLLIGGSAGWMMSDVWLQRFKQIHLIDIDPLAPHLFRLNHGRALRASGTQLNFIHMDGLAGLDALLAAHPEATIFFDNVLGQHVYRVHDFDQAEADLKRVVESLQGRDWGSVHDVFSGPSDPMKVPPQPQQVFEVTRTAEGLSVEGLRDTALHLRLLAQVGGKDEWMDHVTSGVFPVGTTGRLIAWPFRPEYAHWLYAGWNGAKD